MKAWGLVALMAWAPSCLAAPLTLSGYLESVRTGNAGVLGATKAAGGSEAVSEQSKLLLTPTLFGDLHYSDDHTPQAVPLFQGDRTQNHSFQLGVRELTTFGLEGELSYLYQRTEISDVSPQFLPQPYYYQASPVLKVTQSLWRNFFGARTRAEQEQYLAQQLSTQYTQLYAVRTRLAQAEAVFYRLVLARETLRVERESLDRARKIRDWNERRVRLQLTDEADLLQAEANLELRGLEVQGALDEERSASRAFNSARQLDSDQVEDIAPIDPEAVLKLEPPARAAQRDDVRAAAEQARATEAAGTIQLETLSPDLQVYGSYAFNGRDPSPRETAWDSWTANHPYWLVGLRFSAPLDLPLIFQSRRGQTELREAAAKNYERLGFEAESDWRDLSKSFEETRRRLTLWRAVEKAQGAKLAHEKTRFSQGRTTAFQVLSFEQDFLAAQLSRVRAENDIVQVIAKMRTYESAGK